MRSEFLRRARGNVSGTLILGTIQRRLLIDSNGVYLLIAAFEYTCLQREIIDRAKSVGNIRTLILLKRIERISARRFSDDRSIIHESFPQRWLPCATTVPENYGGITRRRYSSTEFNCFWFTRDVFTAIFFFFFSFFLFLLKRQKRGITQRNRPIARSDADLSFAWISRVLKDHVLVRA